MKTKHLIPGLVLLTAFLVMPAFSVAQDSPQGNAGEYTLLEPLPLGPGGTLVDKVNVSDYLSEIFRLTIIIAGAIAVFQLIRGGFMYITSAAFNTKNDAKKIIQETLGGFALVLGAWIIVATIMPESVSNGTFTIDLNIPAIPQKPNTNQPTTPGGPGTGVGPGASTLTQEQVLAQFGTQIGTAGPITLAGLQQGTINELLRIRQQCGCTVVVTSATSGSHNEGVYSHANGYKVDLRSGSEGAALTNFITQNYTYRGNRSDGARLYEAPNGVIYAKEGDHWDVLVTH